MKRILNELLLILPCVENFNEWAENLPYPETVGGHAVTKPDAITLGQYLDLSNIEPDKLMFATTQIMLPYKLPYEVIGGFDSAEVVGLVWGVKNEIEKLNAAFQSISPELSPEEKAAEPPQFGCMSLVDFAARRFGKTYADAMTLSVWEVWQSLQIENETSDYRKRLQEIYHSKNK